MRNHVRRTFVLISGFLGVVALLAWFREPLLVGMGRWLVVETPLQKADLVVALGGNRWRQREAVALMKKGFGKNILFAGADVEEHDYHCLDVAGDQAVFSNLPAYRTKDEAFVVLKIMEERGFKSAIIVTSWYHLRRTNLVFRRAFEGKGIQLLLYPSDHEPFDTETWWHSYIGRKSVAFEYMGLASTWIEHWL